MRSTIIIFLLFFLTTFCIGGYMGCQDRGREASMHESIVEKLQFVEDTLEKKFYAYYVCKNQTYLVINIDNNNLEPFSHKEFTDFSKRIKLIEKNILTSAAIGITYVLGEEFLKELIEKNSKRNKSKNKLAALIGIVTGYTLGYNAFYREGLSCNSKAVKEYFGNTDNLIKVKSDCIMTEFRKHLVKGFRTDTAMTQFLWTKTFRMLYEVCDTTKLFQKYSKKEMYIVHQKCIDGHMKFISRKLGEFNSNDLYAFYEWGDLLKIILSNKELLKEPYAARGFTFTSFTEEVRKRLEKT